MRHTQYLLALAGAFWLSGPVSAADPVVVELSDRAAVGTALVTVGDVARLSGGTPALRDQIARLDLVEFKSRDRGTDVLRRAVEFRAQLAGIDTGSVRVVGAERVTITPVRRAVTSDEVFAAARAVVLRDFPDGEVLVELARPLVVKLPDILAQERPDIRAKTQGRPGATGRTQVDVTIECGGEQLLSCAVLLDVKPLGRTDPAIPRTPTAPPVTPPGTPTGTPPGAAVVTASATGTPTATPTQGPNEILVRPRQRVEVTIQSGGLKIMMVGEAQQAGKLGDTVQVLNTDSKKVIGAKVVGAGKLELDLAPVK
ncbi:MAG: flagella basal body P-ring formation protein FlgA [Gemmataceae bacterium]|nr:flagella basal body P-ring formation protein FlgA [Gemmataceae bacterium]